MTDTEYRTEFTLWCIMSAPLLVNTDVRNMTDIMKKVLLNKDLIKINQDTTSTGGKRISFDKSCGEVSGFKHVATLQFRVIGCLPNLGKKYN